jgi:phosphatidate cytidylyltransferase
MAIVWAADTGALITGKTVGRKKLATLVSPKKTIEGVIGGVFFSMLVLLLFFTLTDVDQGFTTTNYAGYFFLVLIVSCVSVLGDLYESLFKRVSGVKDSGNILPGHGGILDRIDSLTAAAPFFVLGVNLL